MFRNPFSSTWIFWARMSVSAFATCWVIRDLFSVSFVCGSEQIPSPINSFIAHFASSHHHTGWRCTRITDKLTFNFWWTYAGQLVFFFLVILGAIFALTYWRFCWVVFPRAHADLRYIQSEVVLAGGRFKRLVSKQSWTSAHLKAELQCFVFFNLYWQILLLPVQTPKKNVFVPLRVCRCLPQQDVLNRFTTEDGTRWEGFKLVSL